MNHACCSTLWPRFKAFCTAHKYTLGMVCLGWTVFLWVSASFLIQEILNDYFKPFFLTYTSNATFQLYFVAIWLRSLYQKRQKRIAKNIEANNPQVPDAERIELESTTDMKRINSAETVDSSLIVPQAKCLPPMTRMETLKLSIYFYIVYFLASYFANASFGYTDVVSASILLSTSCFFTLIFSVIFKLEKFSVMKGFSVLVCASGVFILGSKAMQSDLSKMTPPPRDPLRGNIYAICSSFLYGVYSVLLKKVIVDEDRIDMPYFFGFVGLLSTFSLWPFFFIFDATGFESWQPPSLHSIGLLIVNNLFGTFLSNYCWLIAVLYTTPLVVAIGISLSTPLTLLFDLILHQKGIVHYRALAGIFVILGFLIINFASLYPKFNYFFENLWRRHCSKCRGQRSSDDALSTIELEKENEQENNSVKVVSPLTKAPQQEHELDSFKEKDITMIARSPTSPSPSP